MSKIFKSLSSWVNKVRISLAICTIGFLAISVESAFAQTIKNLHGEVELQTVGTTNGVVPFWMRSNQFGSIPLSGFSQSFIGRINKDYEKQPDSSSKKRKLIDWGFGIEARGNVGDKMNGQLVEAYAKGKISIFQLKLGRSKDFMGLNGDSTLSSGNFAVSGNAPGIPKAELSIPNYWTVPIFSGLFAIKGNFAHGWLGRVKILDSIKLETADRKNIVYYINDTKPISYYHQKSFYVRMGKADWKLKLYGGFNHQVYWGNEKAAYGSNFGLSPVATFFYVALGKAYGATGIPRSKIGNQIGSIDLGASYEFNDYQVMLYRQNFYDVGALSKLANIRDGLNGIAIENKHFKTTEHSFKWKKVIVEFFYSKDQAGYPWSIPTNSGDEDYYNNYYYLNGWSYKEMGLGSPLITTRHDARAGQAIQQVDYFINNRVVAFHLGLAGSVSKINFLTKLTYSNNYGTFGTSIYGNSTGPDRFPQDAAPFEPVKQFSFYIEADKALKNDTFIGLSTAVDRGKLLDNAFGLMLKVKKGFSSK